MKRREFITLAGGLMAWPVVARAQQAERVRRVAVLVSGDMEIDSFFNSFLTALARSGWKEGRNLNFEIRSAKSDIDVARAYAKELVATSPDVFLATNTQMAQFLLAETRNIPIVFMLVPDPIGSGLVASFAHPGGNVTGFTNFEPSMSGKWLGLLHDVVPNLKRAAVLFQANNATTSGYQSGIKFAASTLEIDAIPISARDGSDIEAAIASIASEPNSGLIVAPSALAAVHMDRIITSTAKKNLPTIYPYREFAESGGLVSYGIDRKVSCEQAATYVDRILRGEKAMDLPVQTPTIFELVVNLKTAKVLGLSIPETFLLLANQVIE